uniref:Uncharacterized protein n=1 Tax=Anguilla anguilla TaxID=7936 RepID=A0A0E9RK69_ANGAN
MESKLTTRCLAENRTRGKKKDIRKEAASSLLVDIPLILC